MRFASYKKYIPRICLCSLVQVICMVPAIISKDIATLNQTILGNNLVSAYSYGFSFIYQFSSLMPYLTHLYILSDVIQAELHEHAGILLNRVSCKNILMAGIYNLVCLESLIFCISTILDYALLFALNHEILNSIGTLFFLSNSLIFLCSCILNLIVSLTKTCTNSYTSLFITILTLITLSALQNLDLGLFSSRFNPIRFLFIGASLINPLIPDLRISIHLLITQYIYIFLLIAILSILVIHFNTHADY